MNAILYVAGRAMRLGKHAQERPKVLLEFGGQSLLDRGQQALGPLIEAIVATRSEHKLILGVGAGARLRQFVADASHELRTPLASIRGYLQLYEKKMLSCEEVERALARVSAEAARMSRLVDELLALARLEQRPTLKAARVDLAQLARDGAADLSAQQPDRPVRLEADRRIEVLESTSSASVAFANLIALRLKTSEDDLSVAGTLFGRNHMRLVDVDGVEVDTIPQGNILLVKNDDTPGIVGRVGTLLGTQGVNIARMGLGRKPGSGRAIMLIEIDSEVPAGLLEELPKVLELNPDHAEAQALLQSARQIGRARAEALLGTMGALTRGTARYKERLEEISKLDPEGPHGKKARDLLKGL